MSCEIPEWGTPERVQFLKKNKSAFDALGNNAFSKDGLIKCSDLTLVSCPTSHDLWLRTNGNVFVCPNTYAAPVTDYLASDPDLWKSAAIRVTHTPSISARALMFGVSFRKSVAIALSKGFKKSEFYLPDQRDDVFYAALLLHVNRRKESNGSTIELQAWQYCPGLSEVFYVHAESPNFADIATHLDAAIIHFPPDEVTQLFTVCEKIMGESYQKQFRLDGRIPIGDVYKIISSFMPITELVDEAFTYAA